MKQRCLSLIFSPLIFLCSKAFSQEQDSLKNTVSVQYNYYHFKGAYSDNWQISSIEYKRETGIGPVMGRFNYADRLNRHGSQLEVEAYPKFSKKVYSNIIVGYSGNEPVFPKFQGGTSVYVNLPSAWEVEGGARYLYFKKSIWIVTAGVSKYVGSWLFNVRSFISDDLNSVSQSYFFTARKYWGDRNNYVWLQAGSGVSPDENRNVQLVLNSRLHSKRINGGIHYFAGKRHVLSASLEYARDEYAADTYSNQLYAGIGYGFRF